MGATSKKMRAATPRATQSLRKFRIRIPVEVRCNEDWNAGAGYKDSWMVLDVSGKDQLDAVDRVSVALSRLELAVPLEPGEAELRRRAR